MTPVREEYSKARVDETAKPRDSWWTVLVIDPAALRLVRLLARRTPTTPGQLTAAAALLGFVAAGAFMTGDRTLVLTGTALFQLALLLDGMDGKLARLTGARPSGMSGVSDLASRVRFFVCATALLAGQYAQTNDAGYLLLGVLAVATALVCPISGSQAAGPSRVALLARHRLRSRPVTEVEFAVAVCTVAPLTGAYFLVIAAAVVLLVGFEIAGLCLFVRALRAST